MHGKLDLTLGSTLVCRWGSLHDLEKPTWARAPLDARIEDWGTWLQNLSILDKQPTFIEGQALA